MLYYTKRFIIIASAVISTIIVIAYSYVFKDKKFEFTAKINENIIQNIQQEEKIINKSKEEKQRAVAEAIALCFCLKIERSIAS